MGRSKIAFKLSCLVVFWLSQHGANAGQLVTTPLQTQSISRSGDLIPTDWGPGTTNLITDPLVFGQFNPNLGTLQAVDITMSTTIRNDYTLIFPPTPTPTTLYVATSKTSDLSILADPVKRAMLTDGPTVNLYAPGGTTQIFGPPATTQPVDFVTNTQPSSTWSSHLSVTDPHFIPPTMTTVSFSRTLDASNAGSLLSDFIGMGKVDLPLTATAFSSFFSSSSNGGGAVTTSANATVKIQYSYSPFSVVPEPSSAILAILGIGTTCLVFQLRRRAARCRGRSSDRGRAGSDIHHV